MTEKELQEFVEQISLDYFHKPFTHSVKINKRFRTTGGRYHLKDHHLEFNPVFLGNDYRDALTGIVKHELTHYHLHILHRGYKHGDADFKSLLRQVGGSRFAPDIGNRRQIGKNYRYVCQHCGQEYLRVRKIDLQKYRCGRCRGRLKLVEIFK